MLKEVIYEYETILLGKQKMFSPYYFGNTEAYNERLALNVIRYAINTYLRWSPEQVFYGLNMDIMERLRLTSLLKYIEFPPEADKNKDMYVIAQKLYPGRFNVDIRDIVCSVYKKVLTGEREKFPKSFFDGNEGVYKAILCLQYAISQIEPVNSVQELYSLLSNSRGIIFLKKWKLNAVSSALFEHPLDYLHIALPEGTRSEYYYRYYKMAANVKIKKFSTVAVPKSDSSK